MQPDTLPEPNESEDPLTPEQAAKTWFARIIENVIREKMLNDLTY